MDLCSARWPAGELVFHVVFLLRGLLLG